MVAILFLSLAALLESIAFPYLLLSERYQGDWAGLVVLHVMLSIAVGLLGKDCLPDKYRRHPRVVIVFFTALTLFIPMLGACGVVSLVVMTKYFFVGKEVEDIQELHDRRFSAVGRPETLQYGGGDLRSRFAASSVHTEARLEALGKLQGFETHQINTTVREALQDQADDIRLVAFGILDKKEKAINRRINQELELFRQAEDEGEKLNHARLLAYAYWELVYKEVVEGDILTYALEQVMHFSSMVLTACPYDAGMWALKGQIFLRSQQEEQAWHAFSESLDYGIPETRVIPYLAELAFRRKAFSELPELLHRSPKLSEVSILHPLLQYWNLQNTPAATGVTR